MRMDPMPMARNAAPGSEASASVAVTEANQRREAALVQVLDDRRPGLVALDADQLEDAAAGTAAVGTSDAAGAAGAVVVGIAPLVEAHRHPGLEMTSGFSGHLRQAITMINR